jgi:hypothetical protein
MTQRLYISGPMTGKPHKNYKAFFFAALALRDRGCAVVNPWELDVMDVKDTWEECLRRDIVALMTCTGVATLPGWKKSRGALLEVYIAKALKWPVHSLKYWRNHA